MAARDQGMDGGGEMAALVHAFDWASTPLGAMAAWPASLRTVVGIVLHSRHPMFLWWGAELVQIYNDAYRPSLGVGKHPAALGQRGRDCWQEIWPIIAPQIDDVMQRAQPSWNEDALVPIYRNGRIEEVYWTYGYSPVFDDHGAVGGTLVVCTETTARVVAERRRRVLRDVAEHTAAITQLAHLAPRVVELAGHHIHDLSFVLLFERAVATGERANRHAAHLELPTALALEALIGNREGRSSVSSELRLPGGAWPEPTTEVFVASIATRPGATMLAVFGISPRQPFDEPYRDFLAQLSEQLANAAARIEAWRVRGIVEAERDNLLLQAPMATAVLIGPAHTFQLANPRYRQIVGREDLVGKAYREAFPELIETPLPGILDRVYQTGEPYVTNELLVPLDRTGGGVVEDCYFKFNLEAMRDAAGEVYGMLAIAVDITDQVQARRHLEQASAERERLLAELETASRTKDEFLALLGHELRNPLSPIVTALELMKLSPADHPAQLRLIERQVEHMVRLVDDLLDVARIARGQLELARAPIEISTVIDRALETASTAIELGRHTLTVDVPRSGLIVEGDAIRLAQVIANLLTNAAKYTPPGGQIWVEARRDGAEVVIRVADTGVGIDPIMLERIFVLFSQVPQDLARSQGGLGLGLAIVKNLTMQHGGTVTAQSAGRGTGSELIVRLPLASPAATVEPIAVPAARERTPKRILIVDDNEDAAWILAETLSRLGHDVQIAHDGPSALELAERHQPELALLDIGLPGMDGYELAARLRREPAGAGPRLIALTGYGQPGDRQRSSDAGFAAHLVKPISLASLVETIDVVIAT